ncbi:heterodisulfide reductase subunit B [Dysgonomonas sp. PH5-45]|uniref:CoB--CoM heterodisulfide reductase iron-sulfur subunit B family protein n=1 Tax=unclassified Dysgonomonas TaxID=2630389 RepID=UPI0024741BE3|nr:MULTISPECIES: CoB--CoM heterodisulfide reductase iron-sulfur subunit B family protein [unclassified Dysgonomonas]MDH6354408.1 heterodisulfide reductase subunit B [Dysgonomonas sp. PH5-45]MDH6387307.1 heterodisulfide reductase subunit B [Dysgonomonas sp. PH5-37]
MKIGFYPGCSLKGTSSEYAQSTLALAKAFGVDLVEVEDWNCCGATAAHNLSHELATALPARILALAQKQGLTELVIPCAACYNRLSVTQHELNKNTALKTRVEEILQMPLSGNIEILNVMQFVEKYIADKIEEKVTTPFNHKVVCYYGCLLVRPHDILKFDRLEDPQSMDSLMRKIGAESMDWGYKTECCGAGFSVSRTDIVAKLSGNIVKDAADRGAQAIIVACPMCQSNLDMRRKHINSYLHQKVDTPVLYITQAIGLAVGVSRKELGLEKLFVAPAFIN